MRVARGEHGQATIAGPTAGQAALRGLLAEVRDVSLELVPVRRTGPDQR